MCQRLRDIFFPTNVLGKDIRCVSYPLSRTQFPINLTCQWVGDRILVQWTFKSSSGRYVKAEIKLKDGTPATFVVPATPMGNTRAASDLNFKCTNVTSLIVNGQQLI